MSSASFSDSKPSVAATQVRTAAGVAVDVEALLVELIPYVRRLMFRLLGPSAWLDDAVQDALIELALALPRYERRSSPRTYAGPIVVRVAYRYFKKRARDAAGHELAEDRMQHAGSSPEAQCMDREQAQALYACLERLPAHHRAAFVLCEVEGLSPAEAARMLRVLPITLRAHLHRARKSLRALLEAQPALRSWIERGEP